MNETKANPQENVEEDNQVINLDMTRVEAVEAQLVRLHQSAVQEITAEEVSMQFSGAFDVATAEVSAHESALGLVSARDVEMTNSAAAAIRADNVNVTGQAGVVVAETIHLGNTYAGMVAGQNVRGERIETLVLLSNRVEGDVQTIVDTRGALIAGMVGGLLAGIFMLVGRFVFGRKS